MQQDTPKDIVLVRLFNMGRGGYRQINKALNICAFEDYLDSQLASLPKLNDVEQLTPRVLRILGQNEGKVRCLKPQTGTC